jgi:hypothetical protein
MDSEVVPVARLDILWCRVDDDHACHCSLPFCLWIKEVLLWVKGSEGGKKGATTRLTCR